MLPFSHDEVIHGKRSLLDKMPGDLAAVRQPARALYGYMYGAAREEAALHGERIRAVARVEPRAQPRLAPPRRSRARRAAPVRAGPELALGAEPALHQCDFDASGFSSIDCNDKTNSVVLAGALRARPRDFVVMVFNFTPVAPLAQYGIGTRNRVVRRAAQQRRGGLRRQQRRERRRHRRSRSPRTASASRCASSCRPSAACS